jgi:hypothetical protein
MFVKSTLDIKAGREEARKEGRKEGRKMMDGRKG